MKHDLDYIFKHIKIVKSKLQSKYPNQYDKAFKEHCKSLNIEDLEELDELSNPNIEVLSENALDAPLTKERSSSYETASTTSAKSLLVNLLETARSRLSSIEIVNGLVSNSSSPSPNPTNSMAVEVNPEMSQTIEQTPEDNLKENENQPHQESNDTLDLEEEKDGIEVIEEPTGTNDTNENNQTNSVNNNQINLSN